MKAMIFSAGLGTRFKPWTDTHPKALAVVNGKSLLQRNVEYLQQYGITDIIVNVHHFADQVIEEIQRHKGWGSRIEISDEREVLLETGGGLLHAKKLFNPGERFITCNVDILTDLNIDHLISYHLRQKAAISFCVTDRKSSRKLLFDANNRLCGWKNEKTGEEKIVRLTDHIIPKAYSCVVLFEYDIFDDMQRKGLSGKFSLIDAYLALGAEKQIVGFDHSGDRLVDVGTAEAVAVAEAQFA